MWRNYKKKKKPLFEVEGAKVKKKPNLIEKLDKVFSLFIRYRDAMPNGYFQCISCGQIKRFEQADCGHYINRQHMNTRFDEMNCNAQCRHCNWNFPYAFIYRYAFHSRVFYNFTCTYNF